MKKLLVQVIFMLSPGLVYSQAVSLTHSKTLYDSFENPAQSSFDKELSRKYAINLFLPTFNTQFRFKGDAETTFKSIFFEDNSSASGLTQTNNYNQISASLNLYLLMFKLCRSVNYNQEAGISLQFRNEGDANIPNSTFAFLNTYKNFSQGSYPNTFNGNGFNQSYWQLGLTYRENYNERWAFGGKLSLLSGTSYTDITIQDSRLDINPDTSFTTAFNGIYTSSFGTETIGLKELIPGLRNPGAAISLGATYTSKKGIYITAHLKDLGFIKWNKETPVYNFDDEFTIEDADQPGSKKRFSERFGNMLNQNRSTKGFTSFTNANFTIAASKQFDRYKPVVVYVQNINNQGGQLALLNNFSHRALNIGINGIYNFPTGFNLGSHFMIKSPNAEWYIGSEKVFPTYYFSKGYFTKDPNIGKSPTQLDLYFGLSMKFGKKMQSVGQADDIPGLNDAETGFISRMRISRKEKKESKKKNAKRYKRAE